jgi:selenocysteine-specific elongation factor
MIIGMAGHIDHGKSALVEALTGRPMDRLAEEKRRGITMDLNFAPLDLGTGEVAGVIDVPGHEDFVRTMVAGASGMDVVLLTVAADEGIMPQTREHLAIIEQLGIARGVPVITKTDLVDPEWAAMVSAEVADWLSGSPVAFGSPVPVSIRTGAGIPELRGRLAELLTSVRARSRDDLFRLPIDRAFSVAGIGTVVTGTTWSGCVAVGDAVRVLPRGEAARVRSIEVHGHPVVQGSGGARTAIGLVGVDRSAIRRGDVVVGGREPWTETAALDVLLSLLPSAGRALAARTRVHLHLGTAEVLARVYPRSPLAPGGEVMARIALEAAVVARGGDRFVLRSYSPVTTIGGGRVLDPLPPRRGAAWPAAMGSPEAAERLQALVERRRDGLSVQSLPVVLGCEPAAGQRLLTDAGGRLTVVGDHIVPQSAVSEARNRVLLAVEQHHRTHPADSGLPLGELRQGAVRGASLADAAIETLVAEQRLVVVEGLARLPGFRPGGDGAEEEVTRVVAVLESAGLAPPSVAELEAQLNSSNLIPVLRRAAGQGRAVAVEADRYYSSAALDQFVVAVRAEGQRGAITPAGLRERLGLSRKFLIPLLEWSDARGVTVRVGDSRRLR